MDVVHYPAVKMEMIIDQVLREVRLVQVISPAHPLIFCSAMVAGAGIIVFSKPDLFRSISEHNMDGEGLSILFTARKVPRWV